MGWEPQREGISQPNSPLCLQPFCNRAKLLSPCGVNQHILEGFLECPLLGLELDLMILVGPFQPRIFSNSLIMT